MDEERDTFYVIQNTCGIVCALVKIYRRINLLENRRVEAIRCTAATFVSSRVIYVGTHTDRVRDGPFPDSFCYVDGRVRDPPPPRELSRGQ